MRVKMLTSMAGPLLSYSPGQVVEMEEKEAKRLISAGFARAEKAETATRNPAEKATKGKKEKG